MPMDMFSRSRRGVGYEAPQKFAGFWAVLRTMIVFGSNMAEYGRNKLRPYLDSALRTSKKTNRYRIYP